MPERDFLMADIYVYADEAGNFDFSRNRGATRFFVIATVALARAVVAPTLTNLRYDLAWRGAHLDAVFHAATDPQAVRDEVFACRAPISFRIDATIFEKCKAQPHLQSERTLYKMAWFLHFKYVAPKIVRPGDRLFVAAASIGTKKKRGLLHAAVHDVVFQVSPVASYRVAFWPAEAARASWPGSCYTLRPSRRRPLVVLRDVDVLLGVRVCDRVVAEDVQRHGRVDWNGEVRVHERHGGPLRKLFARELLEFLTGQLLVLLDFSHFILLLLLFRCPVPMWSRNRPSPAVACPGRGIPASQREKTLAVTPFTWL